MKIDHKKYPIVSRVVYGIYFISNVVTPYDDILDYKNWLAETRKEEEPIEDDIILVPVYPQQPEEPINA